jgi:hypothetical protein
MEIEKSILGLSKSLFWDVDPQTIDTQKHAPYIIEKVITLGTMQDFIIVKNLYGKSKIKKTVKKLRFLTDRDLNFCSIYFNLPITEFRCYITKQLNQSHWNY